MTSGDEGSGLASKLKAMRSESVLTDVVIKCGDLTFPAHRVILAASSLYFQAMFTEDMKEKVANEIEIEFENPEAIMKVLRFIYTEEIDVCKDPGAILGAAEYLQVDAVSDICTEHLLHPETIGEAFEAWISLDLFKKEKKKPVLMFLASKLSDVCLMSEFLNLDYPHLVELMEVTEDVFEHYDVECKFENDIRFEAALRWIKFDLETRKQYMPSFIDLIGLPKLSPGYLVNLFETDAWLVQMPDIALKVIEQITSNLWERKAVTVCLNFPSENYLDLECVRFIDFLMYYFLPKQTLKIPVDMLNADNVSKVCSDKCRIVFITKDWSVVVYNLETNMWKLHIISRPEPDDVISDCGISDGFLYIMSGEKLYQCNFKVSCELVEKSSPYLSEEEEEENDKLVDVNDTLSLVGGSKGFQMFDVENNAWHTPRFKSNNNHQLKVLKHKPFLCQSKDNTLYVLTEDLLVLFVISISGDRSASLLMVMLPVPALQPTTLAFEVFCLSVKRDRYKFFFVDPDGNIWNRMTGPKFEKWRKNECCCNHGNLSLPKIQFTASVTVHCNGNYQMDENQTSRPRKVTPFRSPTRISAD